MAGRDARGHEGRAGGERQGRLGDEPVRGVLELLGEVVELALAGVRPDQHPVAARAVDLLHHQVGQVVHHVREGVLLAAAVGRHVVQDRLLAGEELHDLGHVAVDRLIVRDAGPDRVGEGHRAALVGVHQPRHAEDRIRAEDQRVEEVVVEAAVDHVDLPRPLGGAHVDDVVLGEEVGRLHQLDAELVGQERVLVERGIVAPGGQEHDGRVAGRRARREAAQRGEQGVRVVLHRRDPVLREQVREQAQHHLPVLQHVGDSRGDAGVVLQHEEVVLAGPDDVDARDVDVEVVRHAEGPHLHAVMGVAVDEVGRDDAGLDAFLGAVDVLQEQVDGRDPLRQPALQESPFRLGDHPGDDVERDQPLDRFVVAVDREGDADPAEQQLGLAAAGVEVLRRRRVQPRLELAVGVANGGRIGGAGAESVHLVEGRHRHLALLPYAPALEARGAPPVHGYIRGR